MQQRGAGFVSRRRRDLYDALGNGAGDGLFFGIDGALIEPVPTRAAGLLAERPLRSGLRTDALEAALGRRSLSFAEGLQHLAADPHFRRDFPQFAR